MQTDKAANERNWKWGSQLFATSEEAWAFVRECDEKGIRAGWPSTEYPQGKAGRWYRVAFTPPKA